MRHRSHLPPEERRVRSELAKLVHDEPFVCGSLVSMKRVCGNKRCKCARGDKHVSLYLAIRVDGKRRMIYVPTQWEETITTWVEDYQKIKTLMDDISESCLRRLLEAKAAKVGADEKSRS